MNELVQRLSEGEHPVIANPGREKTAGALRERIDIGLVHIKFTDTRGGTELGVRLDREACDFSGADFENGTGTLRIVGTLTLNYVKVQCIATIDIKTLEGQGHLVPLGEVSFAEK
jgi:hypothetical protein